MLEFLQNNINIVLTVIVVPAATWFFTKRHFQSRELANKDLDVLKGHLNIYNSMITDIERTKDNQISELMLEIKRLRNEIIELKNS